VWIDHGETTVVDDDNSIDQDEDVLLSQYTNEIDEDMGYDPSNEQGGDFGNQPCANDASGAGADRGAREGVKITVTVRMTCFGQLDQKYYYKREVYKI
jgi:hypothetical protein